VKKNSAEKVMNIPNSATEDEGKVRMGSPTFPTVHVSPANSADNGRVRIGTVSPSFPPVRIP